MPLLRRTPPPDPEPAPLFRHPDLTPVQIQYARDNPGEVWTYRYRKGSVAQILLSVLLPEISEPKILTRQRLVQGAIRLKVNNPTKVSPGSLAIWVSDCWTEDLLIVEHGMQHRHYGIVLA